MKNKQDIFLAIFSGILLTLSFAPFNLYFLAWFAIVPLLVTLWQKKSSHAFGIGMVAGFVYFLGTTYWVFNSMYYYGHLSTVISLFMTLLLSLYLSLYVGSFAALFNFLSTRSRCPALLIVPFSWTTLEFLRSYIFTGFPWSSLGYSQYNFLPIIQIADLTGIYGVSFIVASFNGAIYDILYFAKKRREVPLFPPTYTIAGLLMLTVIIVGVFFYGHYRLHLQNEGKKVRVSIVQGNIRQDIKMDMAYQNTIYEKYMSLTDKVVKDSPDLIVWPEASFPYIFGTDVINSQRLVYYQKGTNSLLLFGATLIKEKTDSDYLLANSALLLNNKGETTYSYDKIHLVPFGEYVPLRWLLPIDKLVAEVGEFVSGKENTVAQTPFGSLATVICYEIIFPGLVRKFANNGADMLVTITNDAWFGDSSAPYQHFTMAVLRAVENRMPVVRSANTGISGFIDAKGRVIQKSDIFVEATLTKDVFIKTFQKTFYTKYGDLFSFLCILVTFLCVTHHLFAKH
ncbi:MAG TPA: apolipoprotein N-acyltransferase [Thermodesulfovibrionia bacterium]|nr:apolipoprotein N-acyltransferase [Thermodesulfovibrionia bacterium]